jgi:alkanesulfonate monooxygenase SsuD/methylene tetrahydromethanopterin reductase-like flavin-dependent oxidoreductase (luciferase family)
VQLGISLSSASTLPGREAASHLLDRAGAAATAGLDSLTLGDSHARGSIRYFQNTPTMGRVLAEWTGRPAGCLFLVPMWSPVLIAEQAATLACLHEGPFILQTALGGDQHQYAAMGASRDHRGAVFEEALRLIRALFDGETVSSERFGFSDVSIGLVPPDPVEWWVGTMSAPGLRRAGRMGATWYASPAATLETLPPLLEQYRDACERSGAEPRVALRRDVLILPDGDRARTLMADRIAAGYRGLTPDHLVAGSPTEAADQLAAFRDLGVDQVVVRTMGISPETDLETIEACAEVRHLLT